MKRTIKIISLILISVPLFQILTFQIMGKNSLPYEIIKNRETAVSEKVPRIIFEFQPKLWIWQESKIKAMLEKEYDEIFSFDEAGEINRREINTCEYGITVKYNLKFVATVIEGNGYFAPRSDAIYAETWESQYQWYFYKWIKLNHRCTGQS